MTQLTLSDSLTGLLETKTGDMPPISPAESPPTFASLTIFQRKIEADATALPPSTDNKLGWLGLVITEADYVAEEGHAYAPPTDPGNTPTSPVLTAAQVTRQAAAAAADPALQPTAFAVQEAMRRFQQDKDDYRQHVVIKTILKNQVTSSVHDTYIEKLKKPRTGFAKVTFELLEHLWKTYGNIDDLDLTENEARMKAPWNEPTPIEDLFKQLKEGQEFAARGKEIIADTTLTREGYNIILATGLFSSACRKWRQLKETEQTWSKFQKTISRKRPETESMMSLRKNLQTKPSIKLTSPKRTTQ
jgi:hypothetical protein